MPLNPVIVWFRQDLRLADNPALKAATDMGAPILPVYVLDEENAGEHEPGAASRWWLHRSLGALQKSLNGGLMCLSGRADELLPRLAAEVEADGVFWNRCYEPWRIHRDKRIKARLLQEGYRVRSFSGSLLFEPPHIARQDGTHYDVFSRYYQHGCLNGGPPPRACLAAPADLTLHRSGHNTSVDDLKLLPTVPWYDAMERVWTPGERGALAQLDRFFTDGVRNYREGRNRPDQAAVSRLSPHLHFGELSPHTLWHAAKKLEDDTGIADHAERYLRQLGWREFSHYLLYYRPTLPTENLERRFDRFPWRRDESILAAWRSGRTGYPIVDAAMRELWRTGYIHNRARMVAASFLVKNLLQDWRDGAKWFWDTLVDANLANNSASWQWIAGSGVDAAPFVRIFNPVLQGRKFDPDGIYIRRHLPELETLPTCYLHAPWEAPGNVLNDSGISLGDSYPLPIVDLESSRQRALDAFHSLTTKTTGAEVSP